MINHAQNVSIEHVLKIQRSCTIILIQGTQVLKLSHILFCRKIIIRAALRLIAFNTP